jgi:ribonucleotide reductase beta subunit family protein with ferritin-like domain
VCDPNRHMLLPIVDEKAWAYYKKLEACQWVAQEVNFSHDVTDWATKLSAGERAYYSYTFGLFSVGDELVIKNLGNHLIGEIGALEIKYFFGVQAYNEQVHSESYSHQIQAIFQEPAELDRIMNSVRTMPVIAKMATWAKKWMNESRSLGVRLAGWSCFEGGLFQGQFLGLQLLKSRNLMPGVTMLNEFIQRDEGQHCDFACFLVRDRIAQRPDEATFHQVVDEMVDLYDEFTRAAIVDSRAAMGLHESAPCPVLHITEDLMNEYIRFVADGICVKSGYRKLFGAKNPYPEANKQLLNQVSKTNFFEHESTQYSLTIDMRLDPKAARGTKLSGI